MQSKDSYAAIGIGLGIVLLGMVWAFTHMAFSAIQRDLFATIHHLQWMTNAFGLSFAFSFLLISPWKGARKQKRLSCIGLVIAFFASLIAGFSPNISVLIGCMVCLGISFSMLLPFFYSFWMCGENQEKVSGIVAAFFLMMSPMIGGWVINEYGWRWIYWSPLPFFLFSFLFIAFFAAEKERKSVGHWGPRLFFLLFILPFITALMQGARWGWSAWPTLTLFILGALGFFLLLLKARKQVSTSSSSLFQWGLDGCKTGVVWTFFFMLPLYLQNFLGYTPLQTGASFLLVTMPIFLFERLLSPLRSKPTFCIGSIVLLGSLLFFAEMTPESFLLFSLMLFFGLGWLLTRNSPSYLLFPPGNMHPIQGLVASFVFSISGIFFHTAQRVSLLPNLRIIRKVFEGRSLDEINSFISDPIGSQAIFPSITNWLKNGFMAGFHSMFWFTAGIVFLVLMGSLFTRKSSKQSPL